MTLSASTVFEVRSTATSGNVNSGGFNPTNANMLTDLAATSATGNSPVVTSASYNFVAGDVGAWVYIKGGTNWTPGWYQIASVAANAATLSAAVGQASQVTNNRFITNTVAGCATIASPTGGTWTMDYSQQNAAQFAMTNLASTTGTTNPSVITSATHTFGPQEVGNLIHVTAGTSWTAGWYEIVSVSAGAATLDRAVGTAATLSSGTGKVGGAAIIGASGTGIGDSSFFQAVTNQVVNGGRYFIQNGTYTISGSVSSGSPGIFIEGYNSTRGDRPTGSTRPTINNGANTFSNTGWTFNCIWTGSASQTLSGGLSVNSRIQQCKAINNSATASRIGIAAAGSIIGCEAVSYRGIGIATAVSGGPIAYNYIHDCDVGISGNSVRETWISNIIACCVTAAINTTNSAESDSAFIGNTLYGAENKLGIALNVITGVSSLTLMNNIIYGFSTGVSSVDTSDNNFDDYNDYFNNTADVNGSGNWQKGANDVALDPQFANVKQITGSTAMTTAGNHLVQTGATFITSGVVAGRDYVYIKSGTGVTAGIYGIASVDSETQITTDIALTANATGDKVWQITTGRNFAIGTNLKAGAYPGVFPGGLTTSYLDIGAVQRQEQGGGSYTFG